jgi:hypothetical protein
VLLVTRLHTITSVILACFILWPVASQAQEGFDCAVEFGKAEGFFEDFVAIQFTAFKDERSFRKQLKAKNEAFKKVERAYSLIMMRCIPDQKVASIYKLGCAYEDYAKKYLSVSPPKGLTQEQKDLFRSMLVEKAKPFKEKAIKHFKYAVKIAAEEEVRSEYVGFSKAKVREHEEREKQKAKEQEKQKDQMRLVFVPMVKEPLDCVAGIEDAEDLLLEFKSLKFGPSMRESVIKKQLEKKKEEFEKVKSAYQQVIKECSPELGVEAFYKMGEACENFANTYMRTPRPTCIGLGEPSAKTFLESVLEERANPYRENALEQFKSAVDLAETSGITTVFSEKASERATELEKLIPMIQDFIDEQNKLEEKRATRVEPARQMRLAQARKKKLDEAWEKAVAEGGVLPPSKLEGDKLPFIMIPPAIDPEVHKSVKLFGMDFSDVSKVKIGTEGPNQKARRGSYNAKWKLISKYTLEVFIPTWFGLMGEEFYGAWDVMIVFKDRKRRPIVFQGGLWFGKNKR